MLLVWSLCLGLLYGEVGKNMLRDLSFAKNNHSVVRFMYSVSFNAGNTLNSALPFAYYSL